VYPPEVYDVVCGVRGRLRWWRTLRHDQKRAGKKFELVVLGWVFVVVHFQILHPLDHHVLGLGATDKEQVIHFTEIDEPHDIHVRTITLLPAFNFKPAQLKLHLFELFGRHACGNPCRVTYAIHVDGFGQLELFRFRPDIERWAARLPGKRKTKVRE